MNFALAGNPNSGKTTLFNLLTGSTAHVGNWPGVTVDRREGVYRGLAEDVRIIDLPGIYSLSPYTPEEVVSRRYILEGAPDLIINIVDSTNLERNLYLTTQILESDIPVVVALNMSDVIRSEGESLNVSLLSERLGVPVVEISALRNEGIEELMEAAYKTASTPRIGFSPVESSPMAGEMREIAGLFRENGTSHPVFRAVKAIEGDSLYSSPGESIAANVMAIRDKISLPPALDGDFEEAVADIRYRYIASNYMQARVRADNSPMFSKSDKIDRLLTNKLFGLPIFFAIMFLIFHLTFSDSVMFSRFLADGGFPAPGVMMQDWMGMLTDWVIESARAALELWRADAWLTGLVADGLLSGVGAVLSFLPQILMLFLFLSILEDSGYMARAALLMDRPLRRFGLSGRAFLPMLMGFGCSVPAIMGTRTLVDERERRLTVMLMPFFSCGAKLPIWSLFAAAIFPRNADKAVFGMYLIGLAAAIVTAIMLRQTILKGDASYFIMELPAYRMPRLRNLAMHLWEKVKGFVTKAATIITCATVVIWFLSNFNFSLKMVDANSRDSIVGVVGSLAVPLFRPLGFVSMPDPWRAVVAIVTGLIAKEMVVSTLGVLYNPEIDANALSDETSSGALNLALVGSFSPAAALSFMTFNLLCVPCMAAVAAANAEFRNKKWMFTTIAFWISTAWIGAFIVYHAASLFL
ncbi:MAG: ferrous iron transport protein B [Synergistaceae bacterium]|jgi:ferrous iron transport protein B|nr:ferrous iron transport protein B [Synergistaceae bacterium]